MPELTLDTGAPANGGSCVAHHEGRVVFVRYALPGEQVRVRVTADRGSYWHAEVIEVIEPSADRTASLCPIAGVDGAGCCDLAFAVPEAARALKAQVVANQLERLGGHHWSGPDAGAEPLSAAGPTGWRTRVRLDVGPDRRPGFHRYHSDELVTDLRCAQLPAGMLDGLAEADWPPDAPSCTSRSTTTASAMWCALCERAGGPRPRWWRVTTRRCSGWARRSWRVPVTAFWQAHRDAAGVYSSLVADWAQPGAGMTAWDLYGGAGVFAAVLGDAVGESGRVLTIDTSRAATRAARAALVDLPQVDVITDSVRRALAVQRARAPTWRCWIRRGRAPGARLSTYWPRPGCSAGGAHRLRGSIFRSRYRALPRSRIRRREDQGLRCVPADPSHRMRRAVDPLSGGRVFRPLTLLCEDEVAHPQVDRGYPD